MFPGDEACAAYLEQLRWSSGFVCPACGATAEPWRQTRGRLVCRDCRHQASVSGGTILDKTRTPLRTWFEAAWHVATAKNGLSSKTLERTLGISYRTAWTMLQRYRVAMVRSDRERLSGVVEVDETLVGGVKRGGKRGRGTSKSIVVIAVEVKEPKGFGRVRMRHIPDASGTSLVPFVCDVVAPGTEVPTRARSFPHTYNPTWRNSPSGSTAVLRAAVGSSSAGSSNRPSLPVLSPRLKSPTATIGDTTRCRGWRS